MSTRRRRDVSARLEGLSRRFDRWRRRRKGRSRIPETLWASAVKAAGRHGLNPTARAFRLNYDALKKHAEAARACRVLREKVASHFMSDRQTTSADGQAVATFVELAPPASGGSRECILELEDPGGAKMRVHLKGTEAPDLAALSQSFWSTEVRHRESRRRRT
jgi:hypothetical protein